MNLKQTPWLLCYTFSLLFLFFFFFLTVLLNNLPSNIVHAFPDDQSPTHSAQINSNFVLVALLQSHYTELAELDHREGRLVANLHAVNRLDGVIQGIEQFIILEFIQQDFNNRRSLWEISAVKLVGAVEIDPITNRLRKPTLPRKLGSAPVLPIYYTMAPGPSFIPAPALGPDEPHHHFNDMRQFNDTLQLPQHVVAQEADGSMKFGQGEGSAYLFHPDIYTNGEAGLGLREALRKKKRRKRKKSLGEKTI
jgi:hypothetical protein